jgi:HAE1 family hydrophobic/amphiphilic exporter-1
MNLRFAVTTTLASALVLSVAGPPAAAEALSRREAVARALEVNPDVLRGVEEYNRLMGRATEARAEALPEVNVYGTYLRYQDPSFLNSSSFDQLPPEFVSALKPIPQNLWEGNAQLKQTLFSFSLRKAIRAASYAKDLGTEDLQRVRQQVALRTIFAYNAYLVALERAKVGERTVKQKQQQLEAARNRRASGVATELEVLRFQVDLENARAQVMRLQGAADLARGDLNTVILRPTNAPVEPLDDLAFVDLEPDLDATIVQAIADRPEVKAAAWNARIYDELVGIARADAQPRLDFNGVYGWSVRDTGNFFKDDYQKWSLSVTLKVPVFDGWRTAGRVAQAKADRAKVEQDRISLEAQIEREAKEAVDRLRVAKSVLQAAELNVEQARRALEMTQANYQLGAATTLDVLDAQAALTQADINRVEALYTHADARAGLRYVIAQDPLGTEGASSPAPGSNPVSSGDLR